MGSTAPPKTALESVQHSLRAIAAAGNLNAFVQTDTEGALSEARRLDAQDSFERGPLFGVPVAIKQNLGVRGLRLTAGSRILDGFVAPEDAEPVCRLRRAGAVIVGLTNMDEFAMGGSTETGVDGAVENPILENRVAGGSSGGSAAAVAARLVPVALGSDTGGSIRQPAAYCGVVGLKPTWGRVSRRGLVAFASSLDTVGPIASTVAEAARTLAVIAGQDPGDATSSARPTTEIQRAADGVDAPDRQPKVAELTVGRLRPHVPIDDDVEAGLERVTAALRAAGARVVDTELPHAASALSAYVVIAAAEASSNLARYDGVRYGRRADDVRDLADLYRRSRSEGFGPEVRRRILIGNYVLAEGHREKLHSQAARVRTLIIRDYERLFDTCDLLLGPTVPTMPFARNSFLSDPLSMYGVDEFTVGPSLAGLPAISVPLSHPNDRQVEWPPSVQLIAPWWQEAKLVTIGAFVEDC